MIMLAQYDQLQRDNVLVGQIPDFVVGIPGTSGCFHGFSEVFFVIFDPQRQDGIGLDGRRPRFHGAFINDDFDGRNGALLFGTAAIADADQAVATGTSMFSCQAGRATASV